MPMSDADRPRPDDPGLPPPPPAAGGPSAPSGGDQWGTGAPTPGGWGEQAAWQQPHTGYQQPSQPQPNGLAIAALICGIIALLLSWIPVINFLAIILGIAAVVTGIMGLRRAGDPRYGQRGLAVGGLVTGGLALVVAIAMLAFFVSIFGDADVRDELFEEFERELERQEQLQDG
jgi:hypothetical protein